MRVPRNHGDGAHRHGWLVALRFGLIALSAFFECGCAPIPANVGTWTGRIGRIILETRDRAYVAPTLHITSGPEIADLKMVGPPPADNPHSWLADPILVDGEDRILSTSAFPAGEAVRVLGRANGGGHATNDKGYWLYMGPRAANPDLPSDHQPLVRYGRPTPVVIQVYRIDRITGGSR